MDVTADGLRDLCAGLKSGVGLGRMLTPGHQALRVSAGEQRRILREYTLGQDNRAARDAP